MSTSPALGVAARRGPVTWVLDALSSLWTSIFLLVLVVVYCAVGSAIPPVRQYFEMSEAAYFRHWFFGLMVLLLCVAAIVATARRVRFSLVNGGVIIVHTGLVLLAGGAFQYFGRKVEGSVLLEAPKVKVLSKARLNSAGLPGAEVGSFVAADGKSWETNMPMAGGAYKFDVTRVRHDGMTTAADVELNVTWGSPPQMKTVSLRQDQASARFVDLNEHILLALRSATTTSEFHDSETMSLFVTARGKTSSFPLHGLPTYSERFMPAGNDVYYKGGGNVRSERTTPIPWLDNFRLPIPVTGGSDDSQGAPYRIEVDGYLPYAELDFELVPGGSEFNPAVVADLVIDGATRPIALFGARPSLSIDGDPNRATVEFRWLEDSQPSEAWSEPITGSHVLIVEVKDPPIRKMLDVRPGQQYEIEGTDYRLSIDSIFPTWPLMTPGFEGARSPVMQVGVQGGGKRYQRTVIERYPQLSQDIDEQGTRHREGPYDPNLVLTYKNCTIHNFLIAAGPELSPLLIHTAPGGSRKLMPLAAQQTIDAGGGTTLRFRSLIEKPDDAVRPAVIPPMHRQRQLGRQTSMVRVHVTSADGSVDKRMWLPFSSESGPNARPGGSVLIPDFGIVDFVYSPLVRQLPGNITLEQMVVEFNPGRRPPPRDWISYVRMEPSSGGELMTGRVFLNNTLNFGDWTLFQSSAAQDHESFTVLGVGNRLGIVPMTLGCVLITVGLLYAFYLSPYLKQRLKRKYAAEARGDEWAKGASALNT